MVNPVNIDPNQSSLLQPLHLLKEHPQLLQANRIVIGFSGGMDSTVLLHLLCSLRNSVSLFPEIHVVHINHGLQISAGAWEIHCLSVCELLQVPLKILPVHVNLLGNESPEESARSARYTAFVRILRRGDLLLLAQHQDDQVETVLFRLIRGSGCKGLAGMPVQRTCGEGQLLRPMLYSTRTQLLEYASRYNLEWIEDKSNLDEQYDRNFLRESIIPRLRIRWPGLAENIIRTALLCDEADTLLEELAAQDLAHATGPYRNRLQISLLTSLSKSRQRNLIRYWIATLQLEMGCATPGYKSLYRIVDEVIPATKDADPQVYWGKELARIGLRRYQGFLYLLKPLPIPPAEMIWDTSKNLELPFPLGTLHIVAALPANSPPADFPPATLRVCFRRGGELIQLRNRPTRLLKKILQEKSVPPWLRELIPLLYSGKELIAVADFFMCDSNTQPTAENGWHIEWRRSELHCGY